MSETAIESGSHPEVTEQPTETAAPVETTDPNVTASGEKLDRQTRNWRALEKDRDHWREMAMLHAKPAQATPPAPEPTQEAPVKTLADFEYDESKYSSYLFEQAEKRAEQAAERALKSQREKEAKEQRKKSFATRENEFSKTVEDYHEVTRNPSLPLSQDMVEAIADSDDGPALAYYLGKNPDVAEKIAMLPPVAAARELGKIEARLATERERAKDKSVVSKAPPPPPKVEGASEATLSVKPDDPNSDKLSDDEWARRRRKQLERRSR